MKHYYTVTLEGECFALDETYSTDVDIVIEDSLDVLVPYLYEKHFKKPYKELGWWLEDGAKEFVKDIEDKWLHNELDVDSIFNEEAFKDKYCSTYDEDAIQEGIDTIIDDVESDLNFLSGKKLRQLDADYVGSVDVDISLDGKFITSVEVDIPDPDMFDDDEDEEEDEEELEE